MIACCLFCYPLAVNGYSLTDVYDPYGHTENHYFIDYYAETGQVFIDGGANEGADGMGSFTVTPDAGESQQGIATVSITEYFTSTIQGEFNNVMYLDAVPRRNTPQPITRTFQVAIGETFEFDWSYAWDGPNSYLDHVPYLSRPGSLEEISWVTGEEPGLLVPWFSNYDASVRISMVNHYNISYSIDSVQYFVGPPGGLQLLDKGSNTPVPNPEPATMLLFGSGIVAFAGSRMRKKK